MLLALLLSLSVAQSDGPVPITVDLNRDEFSRGDKARVYVRTEQDGYLVVLHADVAGRVRVLFPLDPTDDAFIRGGKRFELRGRSNRDAFIVDGDDGSGLVLAAVSSVPLNYDGFVVNGHWDYRVLGRGTVSDDPLAGLLDIARRMSGETAFEYDAVTYVASRRVARYGYGHGYDYGYSRFRLGFGYDPFCYDPFWSWSARCYGYGYGYGYGGVGYGFGYTYYPRRPYRFYRPFVVGGFGDNGRRFVMPDRGTRDRFKPVEPRPRTSSFDRPNVTPRDRDATVTRERPRVTPRERPNVTPRERPSATPRERPKVTPRERPSAPSSRPSASRGSSGGNSRPAARPSNGGSRRSGGGGGAGRRN